jgi:hypothetical protein
MMWAAGKELMADLILWRHDEADHGCAIPPRPFQAFYQLHGNRGWYFDQDFPGLL